MPGRSETEQGNGEELSRRQERAQRILNVAAELLLRWGYRKTTIEDIAKQAGVAKGTIYLHWKTREDLFYTLVVRESFSLFKKFQKRLNDYPEDVSLSRLTRFSMQTTFEHPLLHAMMVRDVEMLGDMIHSVSAEPMVRARIEMLRVYIGLLRGQGMLRTDRDIDTQIKMLWAISMGYLGINQFTLTGYQVTNDELIELLVETLHYTFEPEEQPHPEAVREVAAALNALLEQFTQAVERQYWEAVS